MAMGSGASEGFWKARVKAVPSGDSLVVMASIGFPPREKTITLSSLMAPRLARKDTRDEPYAWSSREFLRKLLIGKDITFHIDYTVPSINREFATVLTADGNNVAFTIVQNGWAKVRQPSQAQSSQASPKIQELILAEEDAKSRGVGLWNKASSAEAVRNLHSSAFDSSLFEAAGFVQKYRGQRLKGIVENVRDGSAMRFLCLDDNTTFLAHITGVQCPSAGRKAPPPPAAAAQAGEGAAAAEGAPADASSVTSESAAAKSAPGPRPPPTLAAIAALSLDTPAEPFALEAKHYVELNVLHREVEFVPESFNNNNVFGSIYFKVKDQEFNLALELIKQGFGKFIEGSARSLPDPLRLQLKAADLQAKKDRVRIWTNFVPPPSNSSVVKNDEFIGTVVEIVSGDCMIVAEDGQAGTERRLNLSSIRVPKIRGAEGSEPWAVEGKEFLRSRLIGSQVAVSLEYSRSVQMPSGEGNRLLQFGTILLLGTDGPLSSATAALAPASAKSRPASAKGKSGGGSPATEPGSATLSIRGTSYSGVNVAELMLLNGFGNAERHRDFDERSPFYDALYTAEQTASRAKRGIHSGSVPQSPRLADLTDQAQAKARGKAVLSSIQRLSTQRLQAVVEYVMSGHRLKLMLPSQSCRVFFSLSGVRCPGKGEPFSDDAMTFTRRRALQRDVEVHVEAQDKTGTFLGSCYVGGKSLALMLVEVGLARRLPSYGGRQVRGEEELSAAESRAKERKLKIWEKYVEGQDDVSAHEGNGTASANGGGGGAVQVLQGRCSEVVLGGEFFFHEEKERRMFESMESQLAAADFSTPSPPGFAPKRGEMVVARWSDQSWCRAVLTSNSASSGSATGATEIPVHFIDYGNKDSVKLANIRPIPPTLSGTPALAHLARLAFVKVPEEEDGWGSAAGAHLHELFQAQDGGTRSLLVKVEDREYISGKGQVLLVTVSFADGPAEAGIAGTINGLMLQAGYARIDKKAIGRLAGADRTALEEQEEAAKKQRVGIWQYGHIDSDDEDADLARSRGGRRGAR